MNIGAYQPFSLSDFPGRLAAIVFTRGCNFRCSYCHNPSLIPMVDKSKTGTPVVPVEEVLDFLKQRRGKLDGLVITGGEPTLQEGLISFMEIVKALGYFLKLDTNGSRPGVLWEVIGSGLVDYIAMDIKAPLEKYRKVVNRSVHTGDIMASIRLIMGSGIDYEFRTTVVKSLLSLDDLKACGRLLRGAGRYALQKFIPFNSFDRSLINEENCTQDELEKIRKLLSPLVEECLLR